MEMPSITVYEKEGLQIEFKLERQSDDLLVIHMSAQNSNTNPLTEFLFQAAVPKVILQPTLPFFKDFIALCNHVFVITDIPIANVAAFRNRHSVNGTSYSSIESLQCQQSKITFFLI